MAPEGQGKPGESDAGKDAAADKTEDAANAKAAQADKTPEKAQDDAPSKGDDEKAKRIAEAKKKAAEKKAASKGDGDGDDEKAKKIAEAKKKAAAKKAAAKKEETWPFPPKHKDPQRTEDLDPLQERFGDKILETGDMSGKPVVYVAPEAVWMVLKFAHEELDFDHLPFVSAADYPKEDLLEVHWQLYSYPRDGRGGKDLAVKTHVPRDAPQVPSVVSLWTGAEWHEREAFDMFGIRFDGHRNLRRIFMPDGWKGHPLLKDYDRKEQYIGLSETGEDVVYDTPGPYRW